MKRFFQFIIILIFLSSAIFPTNASAAGPSIDPKRVNWLTFKGELHMFLLNYRAPTGSCRERAPKKGACLSNHIISEVITQLLDPNGDGDFKDSYFYISDPAVRRQMLWNSYNPKDPSNVSFQYPNANCEDCKVHPFVMRKRVMEFEEQTNYWVYGGLNKEQNYSAFDVFVKTFYTGALDKFDYYKKLGVADHWTGDGKLRALAFDRVGKTPDGVVLLSLKPKSVLTDRAREEIYNTPRMQKFKLNGWQDDPDWHNDPIKDPKEDCEDNEVCELGKAIELQNQVIAYLKKHPGKSARWARERAIGISVAYVALDLVPVVGKLGRVGKTISEVKGAVPVLHETALIGRTTFEMTPGMVAKIFQNADSITQQYSTRSFMARLVEESDKLAIEYRAVFPDIDIIMEQELRNTRIIHPRLAKKFYEAVNGVGTYDGFPAWAGERANFSELVFSSGYYGERWMHHEIILHEYIHRLRHILNERALFVDTPHMVAESMTSRMAVRTAIKGGAKPLGGGTRVDSSGYASRKFWEDVAKEMVISPKWVPANDIEAVAKPKTLQEAQALLDYVQMRKPYYMIDTYLQRPGFIDTLNGKFAQFENARKRVWAARGAGNRAEVEKWNAILVANQKEIRSYIRYTSK